MGWRSVVAMGAACAMLAAGPAAAQAGGFLRADGTRIVDETGRPVVLRGMGLGGWLLQEGYMLQLSALGQQHVIRGRIEELIGPEKTEIFYEAWRDNHVTKADIDAMADWGFNSVRLPMHYDQLTLPVDREPVPGADTWREDGFRRIDDLLAWTRANGLYLILDLHAAPGGQGNDLAISDRDPSRPSLWQSAENRRKTVALWRRLAERYADEPGIGGYDLINEPNWSFATPGRGNGCDETENAEVWALQREITEAIRQVDRRHLIILEGNCWGNNYKGLPALWDDNLALSFHKYWNATDAASIAEITALRDQRNVPIWLGESGENSNTWFRNAIALVEGEGAGWAFWPLKKIGFNQPLEITPNPGWAKLIAYWTANGPRPTAEEAETALMRLATHDIRFENSVVHRDVVDAMLRQPHSDAVLPFVEHRVGAGGGVVRAVDYDLGPAGQAWVDSHDADYKGPRERVWWNTGRTGRNDGVDIAREADGSLVVADFVDGDWMRYTVRAEAAGSRTVTARLKSAGEAAVSISVNGGAPVRLALPAGEGEAWRETRTPPLPFLEGNNIVVVKAEDCDCRVESLGVGGPEVP